MKFTWFFFSVGWVLDFANNYQPQFLKCFTAGKPLVPILLKKPKLKNHFFRLFEHPKHTDGFTKEWVNEIGCFIGGY